MTRASALSHFNRQINLQAINKKKLCVKVFSHLTRIDVWFLLVADALNISNTFDDCSEFLSFLKPFNWRISRKLKIFYILFVIERNKNVLNVWCACWSVILVLIWFFFFSGGRFSKISTWKNQTNSFKQGWRPVQEWQKIPGRSRYGTVEFRSRYRFLILVQFLDRVPVQKV